jgi:hypothetical protein
VGEIAGQLFLNFPRFSRGLSARWGETSRMKKLHFDYRQFTSFSFVIIVSSLYFLGPRLGVGGIPIKHLILLGKL